MIKKIIYTVIGLTLGLWFGADIVTLGLGIILLNILISHSELKNQNAKIIQMLSQLDQVATPYKEEQREAEIDKMVDEQLGMEEI